MSGHGVSLGAAAHVWLRLDAPVPGGLDGGLAVPSALAALALFPGRLGVIPVLTGSAAMGAAAWRAGVG